MHQICESRLSWVTRSAHHRAPGADPVEHAPTDLGGPGESKEEVQDVEPSLGGRFAQCDLGVFAGKEEEGHEGQHGDSEHKIVHAECMDSEDPHLHER